MNDRLLSSWILVAGSLGFAYYYYRLQSLKTPVRQVGAGSIDTTPNKPRVGTPGIAPAKRLGIQLPEWNEWPGAAKEAFKQYQEATPGERKAIMDRARHQILRSSTDIDGGESTLANQVG